MRVTVYTDASYHAEAVRGTWALQALGVRDGIPIVVERFGVCPRYCVSSTAAELAAILASVATLRTAFPSVALADVYSDCRFAIELV